MPRSFAIGDIHGCSKTFRKLVAEDLRLAPGDTLYCLGDYVDRGPDSKGVIDFILELRSQQFAVFTLRGNHEQLMIDSIKGGDEYDLWLLNGGDKTLDSFGVNSYSELDSVYREFFQSTEFYYEYSGYLLVHAGFNFRIPTPFNDRYSMLWIRNMVIDEGILAGRTIIHGHTPIPIEAIRRQSSNVINLDGGCVYNHVKGYGNLVAMDLQDRSIVSVKNID